MKKMLLHFQPHLLNILYRDRIILTANRFLCRGMRCSQSEAWAMEESPIENIPLTVSSLVSVCLIACLYLRYQEN